MELKGKVIAITAMEKGMGANGKEWNKLTVVIEEQTGQYPKKQAIVFMNEKAKEADAIKLGAYLTVQINIESREYNGKWYTDVKGWKFEVQNNTAPPAASNELPADSGEDSDLPF
jgi:hypothetical protein